VYRRAALKFAAFSRQILKTDSFFPAAIDTLMLFAAHLFELHFAPASIITYIHAVCYFNKLLDGPSHNAFLLQRMLSGIQRSGPARTPRAPITLGLLRKLSDAVGIVVYDVYTLALLRAMFMLAFHGFLRVREFTSRSPADLGSDSLQLADISFVDGHTHAPDLQVTLRHFKGNTSRTPFTILIRREACPQYCPVIFMDAYVRLRGSSPGPLFIWPSGSPITRSIFSQYLNKTLVAAGIRDAHIRPHSFRIGAATSAAAAGIPDEQIQRFGRWRSDAYRRYVRIPLFHSPAL
jgi:integrase